MTKACSVCGVDVTFPPSRLIGKKHIYCGRRCYGIASSQRAISEQTRAKLSLAGKRAHQQVGRSPNVVCAYCGAGFYKRPCEMGYGRHFCCNEHRQLARATVSYSRCPVCGDEVKSTASRKRRFCSSKCYGRSFAGEAILKNGYRLVLAPYHPECDRDGYIREHRIVMEHMIGRRLRKAEVVHHKNGNKQDNRPENLELYASNRDHMRRCHHTRSSM